MACLLIMSAMKRAPVSLHRRLSGSRLRQWAAGTGGRKHRGGQAVKCMPGGQSEVLLHGMHRTPPTARPSMFVRNTIHPPVGKIPPLAVALAAVEEHKEVGCIPQHAKAAAPQLCGVPAAWKQQGMGIRSQILSASNWCSGARREACRPNSQHGVLRAHGGAKHWVAKHPAGGEEQQERRSRILNPALQS